MNKLDTLLESVMHPNKITEESHPKGFYSDDLWQSITWIDGKPYRERLEILVYNTEDGTVYFEKLENDSRGRKARLPGGSSEEHLTKIAAVIKEAEEEARIKVTEVEDSQKLYIIEYTDKNRPGWHQILKEQCDFVYQGVVNRIFVGRYDGEFNGHIEDHDTDEQMTARGMFYPLNEVGKFFTKKHVEALQNFLTTEAEEEIR